MGTTTLRNDQDPYRRIAKDRFGIDVDTVVATGDAAAIADLQRLLDALAEAYEIGFEDGERYITSNDVPLEECLTSLDTAFLLAMHRGDADLRAHVLAEITCRAATGTDAIVGFAPPLSEQDA
jgi:hypothetical protein